MQNWIPKRFCDACAIRQPRGTCLCIEVVDIGLHKNQKNTENRTPKEQKNCLLWALSGQESLGSSFMTSQPSLTSSTGSSVVNVELDPCWIWLVPSCCPRPFWLPSPLKKSKESCHRCSWPSHHRENGMIWALKRTNESRWHLNLQTLEIRKT